VNTKNEFTEALSVTEEIEIDRISYKNALYTLNLEQLREECMKQYDLSGTSLDKYRSEWQKRETWFKEADKLRRELTITRQNLTWVAAAASNLVRMVAAAIIVMETSADYTHAMKRTARQIIKDMLHPEMSKVETAVENAALGRSNKSDELSDIPF